METIMVTRAPSKVGERAGERGAVKPAELALAMAAQPDPAAAFLKKKRGKLGAGH